MPAPRAKPTRASSALGLSAESVLDASPNPVIAVDTHGRIVYASRKVEEGFGWAPEALLGEPIERLVPGSLTERQQTQRAEFWRRPSSLPTGDVLELAAVRRDGTEFPVEIILAPVRSPRGQLVFATIVDITARASLQSQLEQANDELQRHSDELEERAREMSQLAQLGELLESCHTLDEAYSVVASVAEPLFPGDAGAIYALGSSRAVAEAAAVWGNPPPARAVFPPTECWALRRSRLHVVREAEAELKCPHVEEDIATGLLCVPLSAQAETLGLLHVQARRRTTGKARAAMLADRERLVVTLGEQLALALANIQLRGTLLEQSSRDVLTGLFNRRYMEDSFEREVRRATRGGYGVGVLLADLDGFKHVNDAFGHPAGDEILRKIGAYLEDAVRGDDIACRFGGEEFVVILPNASADEAQRRAEELREGVKLLQEDGSTRLYPTATLSIGVASFPEHGATVSELIHAADSAMYRAKALGRDRVVVAGDSNGHPIEVASA